MRFLKILLLAAVPALFFVACSEDDNSSDPVTEDTMYFNVDQNSYWVYEKYDHDMDGKVEDSRTVDSAVYEQETTYEGRQAKEIKHYEDGSSTERYTEYINEDENSVYVWSDFLLPATSAGGFELPFDVITEQWVQLYAKNKNSWTIYEEKSYQDIEIDIPQLGKKPADITYSVIGESQGNETVTTKDGDFETEKVLAKTNIALTIKDIQLVGAISKTIEINSYLYIAEDMGIIKKYTEPQVINFLEGVYSFDLPGSESVMIRHELKGEANSSIQ